MDHLRIDRKAGVARLVMTRAERHNAFDEHLIAGLTEALEGLAADAAVRIVVLAAEGRSFSAGADLEWMKRAATAGHDANLADARRLAELMRRLATMPQTTVAAVGGAAFGGAVGLVACCDIVVAADTARFSLSEVKLGLIPSAISPYVIAAIGARQARRWFQTAESFAAVTAREIGLVHEVVPREAVEAKVDEIVAALRLAGPQACRASKGIIAEVAGRPVDAALIEMTATRIADIRAGAEAQEGLDAFLSRRPARWTGETTE